MNDTATTGKSKRTLHRSPNYPMFSLRDAIEKAKIVYREDKKAFTTPDVIARHMGFSQAVGGPGGRAMSALRQYGLLEESGDSARISDLAYSLIQYPPDSPEWKEAAKIAVRKPTLFSDLLSEYPEGLPSDAALRSNLLKRGFNPEVIENVISVFRETVSLDTAKNVGYPSVQVGDYVQWESQGMLQFPKPQQVTRLSDDGKFAFFDGSNTGAPIEQLIKASPAEESEKGGRSVLLKVAPKPGMNNDVFTLSEGDVVLQWPSKMSPESYEDFKDWIELMTRKVKRAVDTKDDIKAD